MKYNILILLCTHATDVYARTLHCLETIFFLSLFLFIYFYIKWVINYNNVPDRISHIRPQRVAKRSTADEEDKIPDDVFIICIRTDIIIYSIIWSVQCNGYVHIADNPVSRTHYSWTKLQYKSHRAIRRCDNL